MKARQFDRASATDEPRRGVVYEGNNTPLATPPYANREDDDDTEGEEEGEELYEHFAIVVDKGQSLMRIDRYLATHMEACSRSRIQVPPLRKG